MGIDNLSDYIFLGKVSSIDAETGTAIVTMPDKSDKTTMPLAVLQRGTKVSKEYWMPDIGEQVLCIRLPNRSGKGPGAGMVLGAIYSRTDLVPSGSSATTRILSHPGDMIITVGGSLQIEASGGDVVVNGISLVKHVHGGITPGGSNTTKPI